MSKTMCLPSMNTLFKKNLPLLHIDNNLNTLFLTETFKVVYRRNKNLKELLTLSLFPTRRREKYSCVTSCNTCDIRKNYMVFSSTFFWTVTGEKYYIRGNFSCNSTNVNYAVKFINCKCQNVGSATFSVFISQILKQRKIALGLLDTLILFAIIQLILMVT